MNETTSTDFLPVYDDGPAPSTGPLVALAWLVFAVALAVAPAFVWAAWRWLT